MKPLLNTLYVTTQGAYLSKEGEAVRVQVGEELKLRLPMHTLASVVCLGQVSCSPFLMGALAERGIAMAFLTEHGRFLASVHGTTSGNVLLRREQYRAADDGKRAASIARNMVLAKVANSRNVLLRAARENGRGGDGEVDSNGLVEAAERLAGSLRELEREPFFAQGGTVDSVRGIEGDAARVYFGVFDALLATGEEGLRFRGRTRRPPLDPVNAVLSFVYTLLVHDVRGACESVGLDPAVGFLHRDRPGRPSLALDLMEELRPHVADRLVLSMFNRRQLQGKDFEVQESGAVTLEAEARKRVLVAYQERKKEEVLHPFLEERVPIGLIPFVQAKLLARHLRGDLDGYPPFFWK
jgi:CRISPR-associated protein Cas1